jgi:hypothetical protein
MPASARRSDAALAKAVTRRDRDTDDRFSRHLLGFSSRPGRWSGAVASTDAGTRKIMPIGATIPRTTHPPRGKRCKPFALRPYRTARTNTRSGTSLRATELAEAAVTIGNCVKPPYRRPLTDWSPLAAARRAVPRALGRLVTRWPESGVSLGVHFAVRGDQRSWLSHER